MICVCVFSNWMIIVTGSSNRTLGRIADALIAEMKTRPVYRPAHLKVEGRKTGNWMILDTGDALVHLMTAEAREFYNLEKLWALKESYFEASMGEYKDVISEEQFEKLRPQRL
mmetsp:Transcript_17690/g.53020  ORF Transcript_17690/g.53020 Transcript_17690/m.53020 type:complete len:113 (+) Transcript_17690:964-1302(+)